MSTTPPAMKVSGPAGIVAAAEAMLGFIPANSLVMVCMTGERRRLGPVARVDLPGGPSVELMWALVQHAKNRADEVTLIAYQHNKTEIRFVQGLRLLLDDAGVPVHDTLTVVARKRIWSRNTGLPCPLATDDDPMVAALTLAGVEAGRTVLRSRQELVDSINVPTDKLALAREAFTRNALLRGRGEITQEAMAAAGRGQLTPVQAAAMVRAIELNWEWFTAQVLTELDQPWVPTLVATTAWTPTGHVTDVAALLAIAAYRHGDGALAQVAVNRSLQGDAGNEAADLMVVLMAQGVHPEAIGSWLNSLPTD